MKETFIPKNFKPESVALIERINTILDDYKSQGYELTLRQLYYQLVAANVVVNSERSYKNIGNLVSDGRLAGLIDWEMIEDRARVTQIPTTWINPGHIVRAAARGFCIDKWEDQENHVEVMVEKQALEGVLLPVCRELGINFTANKGYSSSSAVYEASKRMMEKQSAYSKTVHVIYLGDHDPSGIDMTRDIEDRLALFTESSPIEVHRIALNLDQVRKLNPPENPAKLTDSRAQGYIKRFGRSSWELDAIEPKALAKLVRDKVRSLRDDDLWTEAAAREDKMRADLQRFADKWKE